MTRLILVRDGLTDWNAASRVQGSIDVPLNKDGLRQAKKLAMELANIDIDAVYSSAMARSSEVAKEIAAVKKLKPKKLKALNDLGQGLWQGLIIEDIKKRYPKQYAAWQESPLSVTPPEGEGVADAEKRVSAAVDKIAERHKGGNVCIVSHRIIKAIIKCHYLKMNANEIPVMLKKDPDWEEMEIDG